jgi:hypothetical protein
VTNVPETRSPLGHSRVAAPLILRHQKESGSADASSEWRKCCEAATLVVPVVNFPSLSSVLNQKRRSTPAPSQKSADELTIC